MAAGQSELSFLAPLMGLVDGMKGRRARLEQIREQIDSEIESLDSELAALGANGNGRGKRQARAQVTAKPAGNRGGKRTRRPAVPDGWIEAQLKGSGKTLKQLQDQATKDNLSALSVRAALKKAKAKATEGQKVEGKKGKAAQIWTMPK